MKKLLVCICCYVVVAFSYKVVSADESKPSLDDRQISNYIYNVYKHIDFSNIDRLSYNTFEKAYRGYLNLRNAGMLSPEKEILSVCDFDLPSTFNRLWVIDLSCGKVLFNTYVAHGQGTGEDCAEAFSNKFESHQSSLGFYVTSDIYKGEHGISLHLLGMDHGFNDAAYDRGIVMHGAEYVCDQFICENDRLGRSWGCPAVPDKLKADIIHAIEGGTCLFIYFPDPKYLKTAYWLNKRVDRLPEPSLLQTIKMERPKPTKYIIQYMHDGKVDSVKTVPIENRPEK